MLIGLAGYAGAGKSTAIDYLVHRSIGTNYYAGTIVHEEMAKRGLTPSPDNERSVREDLRSEYGMAVFAERALPHLRERCARETVFLDALYGPEECECYRAEFGGQLKVLAISTSFETRAARLQIREGRPIPREKLIERDELERQRFRMDQVVAEATYKIDNDGSLHELKRSLDRLVIMF